MSGCVACGIEVRVASHMRGCADQPLHPHPLQAGGSVPPRDTQLAVSDSGPGHMINGSRSLFPLPLPFFPPSLLSFFPTVPVFAAQKAK